MTEAQAIEAITDAFLEGWELNHPDVVGDPDYCPVAAEGEAFDAPSQWVRLSVIPDGGREQDSIGPPGARRVRQTGNVAVQVFVEVNQGARLRAELADDARQALELKSLSVAGEAEPVRVYAGASRSPTTDGRWLYQLVVFPFDFYATV